MADKPLRRPGRDPEPEHPGSYIGSQPEAADETIPGGEQKRDGRVAGNASQSAGPAKRGANPDPGWSEPPEGHRQGQQVDDDQIRRKG